MEFGRRVIAVFCLYGGLCVVGQSVVDQLSDSLQDTLGKNRFTGLTYGILSDDQLLAARGQGHIRGVPAHVSTLLPVLELSKLFTAVAVLQLIENSELSLTTNVFGNHGVLYYMRPEHESHMDPRLRQITIRDLLYHTGGWDETQGPLYDPTLNAFYVRNGYSVVDISREMNVYGILTQDDIIRFMVRQPLQHDPGKKRMESNFGYMLLGQIVEEMTDMAYEDYVKENILEPCGMWHTRIGPAFSSTYQAQATNIAEPGRPPKMGYIPLDTSRPKSLFDVVPPIVLGACLGWHSNVYDLSRFLVALLQTSDPDEFLLEPSSVDGLIVETGYTPDPTVAPWDGLGIVSSQSGDVWHHSFHADVGINVGFLQLKSPFVSDSTGMSVDNDVTIIYFGVSDESVTSVITDLMTWVKAADFTGLEHQSSIIQRDLATIRLRVNQETYLVESELDEHKLSRYLDAVRLADCVPMWLTSYKHRGHTRFVVISQLAHREVDLDFIVLERSEKEQLIAEMEEEMENAYQISFLHSFRSTAHDGDLNHLAVLSKALNPPDEDYDIAVDLETYGEQLAEARAEGFQPHIQSVDVQEGQLLVSYVLRESNSKKDDAVSVTDLSLDELLNTVDENGQLDYILVHLDTFVAHGQSRFSAVFRKKPSSLTWVIRPRVMAESLGDELERWQQLMYAPSIIAGYTLDKQLNFVVLLTSVF